MLSANRGVVAIALSIRGIHAIALGESQLHRDRLSRIAAPSRSLSANRVPLRSLSANRSFVAIALGESRTIAIALSESRTVAIALSESLRIHRNRSQRTAAAVRSLSRIATYSSQSLSANCGSRAIALANRRVLGELSRPVGDLNSKDRRRGFLRRKKGGGHLRRQLGG